MATVRRAHDPSWGDVIVKEAADPAGRARLAREAAVLERARHPGVVQLVSHRDDDCGVLVTRDAGGRTVADLADLAADRVAAFGAALAQTLADLHRLGVSHGAVRPDHVVVSDQGQPVLCGLADAGLVDPPPGQSGGFDPAADVVALADVLASVLEPTDGLRRRSGGVAGLLRRADERSMDQLAAELALLAGPLRPPLLRPAETSGVARSDDTTADERVGDGPGPARKGGAGSDERTIDLRDLSSAGRAGTAGRDESGSAGRAASAGRDELDWLDESHLEAHPFWDESPESGEAASTPLKLGDSSTVDALFAPARSFGPRPPRPAPDPGRRWTARRVAALVSLALLAVVAGATTVAALGGTGPSRVDAEAQPGEPVASVPSSSSSPPPAEATATAAVPQCPLDHAEAAVVGVPAACADRVSAVGNQVAVGPLRWVVGGDADLATAGDYDCDGWLEVASLSPTGDVALFDGWAGGGQEPVGRIVQHVPDGRNLSSTASGGCHALVVERVGLAPVTVPVGSDP